MGMRYLPLIAGILLICAPAKADKFWLADPKTEQNAAPGSSPNVIEGVLVAEDEEAYHVRVEGGEIVLLKSRVYKVEKDKLSIGAIAKAEQQSRKAGEEANAQRLQKQQMDREIRNVKIANAVARRSAAAVEASASRNVEEVILPRAGFDPILGIATGFDSDYIIRRDAELAWSLTRDRRYLRMIRKLRRLR
jgi:hypothetical protein